MSATSGPVDWEAVRARLRQRAEGAGAPEQSRERLEEVFRARARALADRRASSDPAEECRALEVLAFEVGGERFGLELTALGGALALRACTAVPGAAAELLGVINHHGQICSVLDLARVLGLDGPAPAARYVLLLRRPGRMVGLAVAAIEGLLRVRPDEVGDGSAAGAGAALLKGLVLGPRCLRLLSPEALLSLPLFTEAAQE